MHPASRPTHRSSSSLSSVPWKRCKRRVVSTGSYERLLTSLSALDVRKDRSNPARMWSLGTSWHSARESREVALPAARSVLTVCSLCVLFAGCPAAYPQGVAGSGSPATAGISCVAAAPQCGAGATACDWNTAQVTNPRCPSASPGGGQAYLASCGSYDVVAAGYLAYLLLRRGGAAQAL